MSQDIVADALNQIMNAKRVEKKEITVRRISKLLINLLNLMKEKNYIDYIPCVEFLSYNVVTDLSYNVVTDLSYNVVTDLNLERSKNHVSIINLT